MEAPGQNKEVHADLIEKITGLHAAIAKLPSLSPTPAVRVLFADLVTTCLQASPVIDVSRLGPDADKMRQELVRLCADAEGQLEAHYSDVLAAFDNPLDHLATFPSYGRYVNMSRVEYGLLARHGARHPARVAFVGSGPLPLSSILLATRHLPSALFNNYDRCGAANDRARRLVHADGDVGERMAFHTADVANLTGELAAYDVVFLAALVGADAAEKEKLVAHLGKHMAAGAVLVVRTAHGARAFLRPTVDPEAVRRGGFDVVAVHHADGEAINSVIVASKRWT